MKRVRRLVPTALLILPFLLYGIPSPATAASPSIYESISGSNGTNITSAGSSDSVGFTGNWSMVNANKNPGPMTGVASVYKNDYNSNLRFPSGSRFALPASNTAAGTTANLWNMHYSARQISTPVNFDSNGNFYLSFLGFSPVVAGSWGSYMVGLLNGLPTSTTDTSKNGIFLGRSYNAAPLIQATTANVAVWNPGTWSAQGSANNPAAPDGNAWFIIAKITTATSGNDSIRIKFFASTDTVPISEASITWDATYSAAITGNYSYLSTQTEYNAVIDEIRGATTYEAVSGVSVATTLGAITAAAAPKKGVAVSLSITSTAAGSVRFYSNGKRIPNCLKVSTTGSSPNFTATCLWKPSATGSSRISAEFTSSDPSFLNAIASATTFQVASRTNKR